MAIDFSGLFQDPQVLEQQLIRQRMAEAAQAGQAFGAPGAAGLGFAAGRLAGGLFGRQDPRVAQAAATQGAVRQALSSGIDLSAPGAMAEIANALREVNPNMALQLALASRESSLQERLTTSQIELNQAKTQAQQTASEESSNVFGIPFKNLPQTVKNMMLRDKLPVGHPDRKVLEDEITTAQTKGQLQREFAPIIEKIKKGLPLTTEENALKAIIQDMSSRDVFFENIFGGLGSQLGLSPSAPLPGGGGKVDFDFSQ